MRFRPSYVKRRSRLFQAKGERLAHVSDAIRWNRRRARTVDVLRCCL